MIMIVILYLFYIKVAPYIKLGFAKTLSKMEDAIKLKTSRIVFTLKLLNFNLFNYVGYIARVKLDQDR